MRVLYTLGIYLYTLGIRLAALFGHRNARLMARGWKAAAIKDFKRAAKADKNAPAPLQQLANVYERIGLEELAEEFALRAKKLRERKQRASRKRRKDKD